MCQITTELHEYPKRHGLSIEWIADHIGVNVSTLQRYLNPHDDLPFPLKVMIPFMRACNNDYTALDLLESRLGRTSIDISNKIIEINYKSIAKLAKEAGEAIAALGGSIADGKIDNNEKKICSKELLDLQKTTNALLMQLNK